MNIIPRQRPRLPRGSVGLFLRLLRRREVIDGPAIGRFEQAFAEYVGVRHAARRWCTSAVRRPVPTSTRTRPTAAGPPTRKPWGNYATIFTSRTTSASDTP